jgi:hypothetical protein
MLDDPDFELSKDEMDGVNELIGSDDDCFQLTQGDVQLPQSPFGSPFGSPH